MNVYQSACLSELADVAMARALRAPESVRKFWVAEAARLVALERLGCRATKVVSPPIPVPPLVSELSQPITLPAGTSGFACVVFRDEIVPWNFSAVDITHQIAAATRIRFVIDSPGGDAPLALEIIRATEGKEAETEIIAHAFSSAALLALAGSKRRMAAGAWMMIHPIQRAVMGAPQTLRHAADELDKMIAEAVIVFERAGIRRRLAKKWLTTNSDFYFSAEDAKRIGLVTEIYEPSKPI